ncbi:Chemokine XC receptor 1, partial [Ophiophagus hannah]
MTILRYLAVVDPLSTMRTQTKKCSILVSMAIWSSSIMVAVPEIIFIEVIIDNNGKQHCEYEESFIWKLIEMSLQHVIKPECQTRNHIFFAFDISRKVAYCHCCINPILYVFVGVKFRRHLKLLYKQLSPCHSRISPSSPRMHSSHLGPYDDASIY